MIRTVAFDADETLITTSDAVSVALRSVVTLLDDPVLTYEMLWRDGKDFWAMIPEEPARVIRTKAIQHSLARVGREAELERAVEHFFEVRFANTRPYAGVVEALELLRPDYKLGYATNGNSEADRCGLAGQFGFELYALRNGVPKKPAVAFYQAIAEQSGCAPDEIVYVGDTYEHDIVGPARFGMRTVWINRMGLPVPGEVRPDAVIDNLMDLPRILAGWR